MVDKINYYKLAIMKSRFRGLDQRIKKKQRYCLEKTEKLCLRCKHLIKLEINKDKVWQSSNTKKLLESFQ